MHSSNQSSLHNYWISMLIVAVHIASRQLVCGQGTVNFQNFDSGAAVYDVNAATPLAGPSFLAELYGAAPGNSLVPISVSITPFSTGGYFFGPDAAIPGVPVGGTAILQVVAWRASDGATFAAANHPGAHVGSSAVFQMSGLAGAGLGMPSPSLTGMQSFSLYVVPEPSVLYLGVAGLGGLMLCRRWWRR